jgi:hypothetical protein
MRFHAQGHEYQPIQPISHLHIALCGETLTVVDVRRYPPLIQVRSVGPSERYGVLRANSDRCETAAIHDNRRTSAAGPRVLVVNDVAVCARRQTGLHVDLLRCGPLLNATQPFLSLLNAITFASSVYQFARLAAPT